MVFLAIPSSRLSLWYSLQTRSKRLTLCILSEHFFFFCFRFSFFVFHFSFLVSVFRCCVRQQLSLMLIALLDSVIRRLRSGIFHGQRGVL